MSGMLSAINLMYMPMSDMRCASSITTIFLFPIIDFRSVDVAPSNKLRTSGSSPLSHSTSSRPCSISLTIVVLPTWRAPNTIIALPRHIRSIMDFVKIRSIISCQIFGFRHKTKDFWNTFQINRNIFGTYSIKIAIFLELGDVRLVATKKIPIF